MKWWEIILLITAFNIIYAGYLTAIFKDEVEPIDADEEPALKNYDYDKD